MQPKTTSDHTTQMHNNFNSSPSPHDHHACQGHSHDYHLNSNLLEIGLSDDEGSQISGKNPIMEDPEEFKHFREVVSAYFNYKVLSYCRLIYDVKLA